MPRNGQPRRGRRDQGDGSGPAFLVVWVTPAARRGWTCVKQSGRIVVMTMFFYDDWDDDRPTLAELGEGPTAYERELRAAQRRWPLDSAQWPEPPEEIASFDGGAVEEPVSAEDEETFPPDWQAGDAFIAAAVDEQTERAARSEGGKR